MAKKVEIKSPFLKESLADADVLRMTAIETAKLSFEDALTQQVEAIIQKSLLSESSHEGTEKARELAHEEGEPEGSSEMPADSSEIGSSENKEPSDDSSETADDDTSGEAPADSKDDWYDDWSESDFDLDEVISELQEDEELLEFGFNSGSSDDEEGDEEDEEEGEGEEGEGEEEEEGEEGEGDSKEAPTGDAPVAPAPTAPVAAAPGAPTAPAEEPKFTLDEFLEIVRESGYSLEEIAPVEEEQVAVEGGVAPAAPVMEADGEEISLEEMVSVIRSLKEENAEYRQAFKVLRGKLTETNLLNAKLLYTNKIIRKSGLSDEQKANVLESFDKATSIREVKMVYDVLAETIVPQTGRSTKTASSKRVAVEGFASKSTKGTAPKAAPASAQKDSTGIISEAAKHRFQHLAGIIKD